MKQPRRPDTAPSAPSFSASGRSAVPRPTPRRPHTQESGGRPHTANTAATTTTAAVSGGHAAVVVHNEGQHHSAETTERLLALAVMNQKLDRAALCSRESAAAPAGAPDTDRVAALIAPPSARSWTSLDNSSRVSSARRRRREQMRKRPVGDYGDGPDEKVAEILSSVGTGDAYEYYYEDPPANGQPLWPETQQMSLPPPLPERLAESARVYGSQVPRRRILSAGFIRGIYDDDDSSGKNKDRNGEGAARMTLIEAASPPRRSSPARRAAPQPEAAAAAVDDVDAHRNNDPDWTGGNHPVSSTQRQRAARDLDDAINIDAEKRRNRKAQEQDHAAASPATTSRSRQRDRAAEDEAEQKRLEWYKHEIALMEADAAKLAERAGAERRRRQREAAERAFRAEEANLCATEARRRRELESGEEHGLRSLLKSFQSQGRNIEQREALAAAQARVEQLERQIEMRKMLESACGELELAEMVARDALKFEQDEARDEVKRAFMDPRDVYAAQQRRFCEREAQRREEGVESEEDSERIEIWGAFDGALQAILKREAAHRQALEAARQAIVAEEAAARDEELAAAQQAAFDEMRGIEARERAALRAIEAAREKLRVALAEVEAAEHKRRQELVVDVEGKERAAVAAQRGRVVAAQALGEKEAAARAAIASETAAEFAAARRAALQDREEKARQAVAAEEATERAAASAEAAEEHQSKSGRRSALDVTPESRGRASLDGVSPAAMSVTPNASNDSFSVDGASGKQTPQPLPQPGPAPASNSAARADEFSSQLSFSVDDDNSPAASATRIAQQQQQAADGTKSGGGVLVAADAGEDALMPEIAPPPKPAVIRRRKFDPSKETAVEFRRDGIRRCLGDRVFFPDALAKQDKEPRVFEILLAAAPDFRLTCASSSSAAAAERVAALVPGAAVCAQQASGHESQLFHFHLRDSDSYVNIVPVAQPDLAFTLVTQNDTTAAAASSSSSASPASAAAFPRIELRPRRKDHDDPLQRFELFPNDNSKLGTVVLAHASNADLFAEAVVDRGNTAALHAPLRFVSEADATTYVELLLVQSSLADRFYLPGSMQRARMERKEAREALFGKENSDNLGAAGCYAISLSDALPNFTSDGEQASVRFVGAGDGAAVTVVQHSAKHQQQEDDQQQQQQQVSAGRSRSSSPPRPKMFGDRFTFEDGGDGLVRIVWYANSNLALTAPKERHGLLFLSEQRHEPDGRHHRAQLFDMKLVAGGSFLLQPVSHPGSYVVVVSRQLEQDGAAAAVASSSASSASGLSPSSAKFLSLTLDDSDPSAEFCLQPIETAAPTGAVTLSRRSTRDLRRKDREAALQALFHGDESPSARRVVALAPFVDPDMRLTAIPLDAKEAAAAGTPPLLFTVQHADGGAANPFQHFEVRRVGTEAFVVLCTLPDPSEEEIDEDGGMSTSNNSNRMCLVPRMADDDNGSGSGSCIDVFAAEVTWRLEPIALVADAKQVQPPPTDVAAQWEVVLLSSVPADDPAAAPILVVDFANRKYAARGVGRVMQPQMDAGEELGDGGEVVEAIVEIKLAVDEAAATAADGSVSNGSLAAADGADRRNWSHFVVVDPSHESAAQGAGDDEEEIDDAPPPKAAAAATAAKAADEDIEEVDDAPPVKAAAAAIAAAAGDTMFMMRKQPSAEHNNSAVPEDGQEVDMEEEEI